MADAMPDYALERKKIEVKIGQLRQNILASELRQMTLSTELAQIDQSIQATEEAIAQQEDLLTTLPTDSAVLSGDA